MALKFVLAACAVGLVAAMQPGATRRSVFKAAPAALVGVPAAARAEDFATNLKPLYEAAKKAKLTHRSSPGELGPEAFAEDAFVGSYTDPINHPGGTREITLTDKSVGAFRLVKVAGGGGRGEPKSYELPGLVDANRITVDFSPKGGPAGITGVLTPGSLFKGQMTPTAIKWPDGNSWPKTS